ncbi:OmpA family protein [Hyphomicrobium methylovorum]|uniref:OmpA family protein n=1 Tax=Hyphomicrobium methylovorum TaxID=84 RepID=UPI0015E6FDAC|nr:OmpA family protein [Hyphomicrobium methylovorum]MBA2125276.1 OmpA family protein [Hyphomicrobium methylovorum]
MRCNPSYWLLGLIPIAILSWVAVEVQRDDIESDLARRTSEALNRAGLGWAAPNVSGRDVILTGRSPEDRGPGLALAYAKNIWGVRVARNRAELIEHVDNYRWSATSDGPGRLRLGGYVPSEAARQTLLDAARNEFPKAAVADEMRLARGSIDRDTWLAGAKFTLKNLAALKRGEAELSALDLSMRGEAPTSAVYREVRTALESRRPRGVNLASAKISAPIAKPFVWAARKGGDGVTLSGFAPTDGDKAKIASRAKTLFGKMTISDRSDVADGSPKDWAKAVAVTLDQLAQLKSGEASFSDRNLTFTGEAADEQVATAVRRSLKLDVPQNFKIVDRIHYPRSDLALPSGGYVMGIVNTGTNVDVIGMVPSEAARAALVDAVRARFPNRTVNDKTQVAAGAPEGWQQCVVAGLASLPRLKNGKSILSDRKLDVSGETDDYAAAQTVPGDVKAAAGQTCETTANISFTGTMKTDLSWKAIRESNSMITLEGEAPDDPSRLRLIENAQRIYPGESIADNMKVVGASAEPWLSASRVALEQLSKLRNGDVSIEGKNLAIHGAAETDRVANDVRSVLSTDLPPGFKVTDAITVMSVEEKAADSCQTLMRQTSSKGVINFDRAKADLTQDSTQTLKDLAEIANECPAFSIQIEGHTDAEGTDERNQRLSDRRARAVADFLGAHGVDARRLTTIGYGATRPIADNATEAGRAKNRRIEFNVKVN